MWILRSEERLERVFLSLGEGRHVGAPMMETQAVGGQQRNGHVKNMSTIPQAYAWEVNKEHVNHLARYGNERLFGSGSVRTRPERVLKYDDPSEP